MKTHQFHFGRRQLWHQIQRRRTRTPPTQVLKQHYQIEEDWGGTRYTGLTEDWDYKRHEVHISMPGYVEKALARFGHQVPKHPQHQMHTHTIPTYGATIQYAKVKDKSDP